MGETVGLLDATKASLVSGGFVFVFGLEGGGVWLLKGIEMWGKQYCC